jgi:hypothetical protein
MIEDRYNPPENQQTVRYAMPIARLAQGPRLAGAK